MVLRVEDGVVVEDATAIGVYERFGVLITLAEEAGQSMVEFALIVPLFLIIVTGIFAFGLAFNNWEMMTEATSVGARAIAISRGQTLDPCQTAAQAIEAAAPSLNASSLTFSFSFNGVPASGATCSSSSTSTGAAGNLLQGSTAQVSVTYPCALKVFRTDYAASCLLHAQTTELVQ
jgi:Flp pilus assembly protein TadG